MRAVRSAAAVAALAAAALVLATSPATAATAASTSVPAAASGARPGGPHAMPMRSTPGAARSAVVAAAAPVGSHLTYYNGRVVSHAEVVQVLWGAGTAGTGTGQYLSQVLNTASPSVATFYQGVLNSSYVDWLSEYTTPTQTIGRGSFVSQVTITPSTRAGTRTTISDATIQTELTAQITAGHLPAPHQDAAGNNNTYYAIFFPHGKVITMGGTSSCVSGGFVAYHGTIANAGGHEIYYGVHPDMQALSGCENQGGTGTVFGDVTAVASHELVETMTDPEVGLSTTVGPPLAWYDATNGEIGDICNGMPGAATGSDGLTYSVQTQWSNAQNTCTVGATANDFSLAAPSPTVLAGSSGTTTVSSTVVSGAPESVALSVTGLPAGVAAGFSPSTVLAGNPSTLTLTVGSAVAAGTYSFTVTGTTPSATRNVTSVLTVTRGAAVTSSASTTFTTGTVGTFTVTTAGSPIASLTESGTLPTGISFADQGDGTAIISGTPASGTGGSYPLTITAANGAAADAVQPFTLLVHQAAAVTSGTAATFGVGAGGSFTVTSTGFPAPTITESGPLPSGVTFAGTGNGNATLSGTPASGSEGVYTVTLTASNGVGAAAAQSFTLTVTRQAAITSAAAATFVVGSAGTFVVTTVGVPKASISESGLLPTGVTVTDNGNGSATVAGTPAAGQAGAYPLTFTAHNGIGTDAVQAFVLTVHQSAAITSATSTRFVVGTSASFTVTSTGTPSPTLSESGTLPTGVTFTDNGNGTATLSGSAGAGAATSYAVTITAHNGVGTDAQQSFLLHVDRPAIVTSAASTTFAVGAAGTFGVTTTGAPAPSITPSGTLPAGVTFSDNGNGTATLSGTPAAGQAGAYPLTFTAHNGVGPDAVQSFVLTVRQPAAITSATSVRFVVGSARSFTVTSTGDPAPALSEAGSLPPGVTFTDNGNGTATLSGTPDPAAAPSYALSVTAHNGVGADAQQPFVLHVDRPATVTSAASTTFVVGTAGTFSVTSLGAPTASLSCAGTLPLGITFLDNGNGTATLAGTSAPGQAGSYPLTFMAHNGIGSDGAQSFVLTVQQAAAITSAASTTFAAGAAGSFTVTASGSPAPALTLSPSSALPAGVTFVDHGDGTGSLSGTPATGASGDVALTITAHNGAGPDAVQPFVLHVSPAVFVETPPVLVAATTTVPVTIGDPVTTTVLASGLPVPRLSTSSVLPAGLVLVDNGDGTATLSGVPQPGSAGSYTVVVGAANGVGSSVAETITVVVSRRTAVVTTGPGYLRQLVAVRGRAGSFVVHASVRRPANAPASDLGSLSSVRVRLVPVSGGAARTCLSTPGSATSRMSRTATGGWSVSCRFPAGTPVGVYVVRVDLGPDLSWSGGTSDVLLVAAPGAAGAHGAGLVTGAGLPVRSTVAFAFAAARAGRGGRAVSGRVVAVLSVTDPVSGLVTQHLLTSRTVTGLLVRAARAPFTATVSGVGRWDSGASARFSLVVRDTTGAVRDGDRYGQVIAAPAASSSDVAGLLRLRAVVVSSGDIAVR